MRIPFGSLLECCLTSLPLLGCVGGYTALPPQARPPPIAFAATMPEQAVYTARATTPAAVLVVMPGTVEFGEAATGNPALWATQGFAVVMPRPQWVDRVIPDQQAAVERLLAAAQAVAAAPVWLVGPSPAIDAVMPRLGPGQVSGVVVTSVFSGAGGCSRTVHYSSPGNGAEPKVMVKTSGDACNVGPSFGTGQTPASVIPAPRVKPGAPRVIEASLPADSAAQ